jgi:glycerophosphoryl diester phosphodiesterase
VTDPDYRPYVTKAMVDEAHELGIKVIPWTVDDPPKMIKLIDDGVDGLITAYPDRLRTCSPHAASGCRRPTARTGPGPPDPSA